jgi:hypothetical protein
LWFPDDDTEVIAALGTGSGEIDSHAINLTVPGRLFKSALGAVNLRRFARQCRLLINSFAEREAVSCFLAIKVKPFDAFYLHNPAEAAWLQSFGLLTPQSENPVSWVISKILGDRFVHVPTMV